MRREWRVLDRGSYGGGSFVNINVDSGLVTGLGYDSSGNAELSIAGAGGSNTWGAWTQTFAGAANNDSWAWTFTKSFFTFAGGPGNMPTCAGQTLRSIGNELTGNFFNSQAAEKTLSAASAAQTARALQYAATKFAGRNRSDLPKLFIRVQKHDVRSGIPGRS
jgi:hypothetical protein